MKITLRHLILFVAFLSVGLALFSSITAGYLVNQKVLIDNTLETNRVYAQKLASVTDNYMKSTLHLLEYSAKDIPYYMEQEDSETLLANEVERLFEQNNTFNSAVITSASGQIIAASPNTLGILGEQVESPGGLRALSEKKALISKPYMSITGRLIIFISQPIFDDKGNYLGYVGGSIYLLEKSILNDLLGEHFYEDGSYVYVVDEDERILYHPDQTLVGDIISDKPVMNGSNGATRLVNSGDVDMLAGYAFMPTTKWRAVAQRPAEAALSPATDLRNQMFLKTLPFLFFSLVLIIYISNRIARPLQHLAHYARSSTENESHTQIKKIDAWYYEAIQLEKALVKSFSFFQDKVNYFIHESTTDPLTGLVNRRGMDEYTKKWTKKGTPYSIILFDIDRFKRINDTYGHTVGDLVLKYLAKEMRAVARNQDICCRYGGEEFILLLPETTMLEAFKIAEKLRNKLEMTVSPSGDVITISSGIASFPEYGLHAMKVIEVADKCLYEAKNSGRNKSILAEPIGVRADALT